MLAHTRGSSKLATHALRPEASQWEVLEHSSNGALRVRHARRLGPTHGVKLSTQKNANIGALCRHDGGSQSFLIGSHPPRRQHAVHLEQLDNRLVRTAEFLDQLLVALSGLAPKRSAEAECFVDELTAQNPRVSTARR